MVSIVLAKISENDVLGDALVKEAIVIQAVQGSVGDHRLRVPIRPKTGSWPAVRFLVLEKPKDGDLLGEVGSECVWGGREA